MTTIVKNGASIVRLTQSNPNFNGNTCVKAGVLQASANQSFGDGINSTVTALVAAALVCSMPTASPTAPRRP